MKKLITICVLLANIFTIQAQQKQTEVCDCPEPKGGKFVNICTLIENQDLNFKEAFEEMSCVDLKKDSKETVRVKVNCIWEKYYKEYGCNSTGFLIAQGNILKYAVNYEFAVFVDGMVRNFGININLKDPSDGKTLLDFVTDEIIRYKNNKDYPDKAPELQRIYNHYKNDLNALHSYELLSQHSLPYTWSSQSSIL